MAIIVKVDLRTIDIRPHPVEEKGVTTMSNPAGYLADIASEFGARELIATTEDEYTTEFCFEGESPEADAANAAAFRKALRSFPRHPASADPDDVKPVDGYGPL